MSNLFVSVTVVHTVLTVAVVLLASVGAVRALQNRR
jgi:hypothetical protein